MARNIATRPLLLLTSAVLILLAVTDAGAQDLGRGDMAMKNEGHARIVYPDSGTELADELKGSLRFEPITMLKDLYRNDIVLLMRHGPTDWSQTDARGVDPKDCMRQRNLTPEGREEMRQLGMHLAVSEILPAEIRVSPWCRGTDTFDALMDGIGQINPDYDQSVDVTEDYGLGLLLSLGGAATVMPIRAMIDDWEARGPTGPLLLITHYTNIEELTNFKVYEGEILVLDPMLDNRVLGYLRMESARPDSIHFDVPNAESNPN
jgi:Histidine phosphatase superfamily (branch 1)